MKILMVSDAANIHTKRWAAGLTEKGIKVILFSITPLQGDFYARHRIPVHVYDLFSYKKGCPADLFASVPAHLNAVQQLKKLLKKEKPDILHAHYATSYGFIAALSGYHPLIVSVWGSDIYEFPRKSPVNRMSVEFTLSKADRVLSTSYAMAEETKKYFKDDIGITPFGTDCRKFAPKPLNDSPIKEDKPAFVFGTVKTLSQKYGIDLLLKAFAEIGKQNPKVHLIVAGGGPDREKLEQLAVEIGVATQVSFVGPVAHDDVPALYAKFDAAVFLSREESFGVSAVEAMACGCPVIASDADGFREILEDGAGLVVPRGDVSAAAAAMRRLIDDGDLRSQLAQAGRRRAETRYDWNDSVATMIEEYKNLLE